MNYGLCEQCGDEAELGVGGICEDCHIDQEADEHQEDLKAILDDDRYWDAREDAAVTEAEYQSSPEDFEE